MRLTRRKTNLQKVWQQGETTQTVNFRHTYHGVNTIVFQFHCSLFDAKFTA